MKKIIALILAVSCVFALASCKFFKKDKSEGNKNVDREAVESIIAAAVELLNAEVRETLANRKDEAHERI